MCVCVCVRARVCVCKGVEGGAKPAWQRAQCSAACAGILGHYIEHHIKHMRGLWPAKIVWYYTQRMWAYFEIRRKQRVDL